MHITASESQGQTQRHPNRRMYKSSDPGKMTIAHPIANSSSTIFSRFECVDKGNKNTRTGVSNCVAKSNSSTRNTR